MGAAALLTNAALENTLLGEATGRLSWGSTLFRALLAFHGLVLLIVGAVSLLPNQAGRRRPVNPGVARDIQPTSASTWLALAGMTVIAVVLRLWNLGSCLWFDEVLTLIEFVRRPLGAIVTMFPSQNQHMFFSVLAHASVSVLGESAATVRLPSVVFGVASIWVLFALGRRTIGSHQALIACALLTVSYHHVWFSQNARGYMGLLFFALLATWLWIEALDRSGARWWACYAVSLALGTWMHMTMVFIPATHVIVFLMLETRLIRAPTTVGSATPVYPRRLLPLAAWVLSGTITLQLYALALPEFFGTALHEVSLTSEWTNPWWVVWESLRVLSETSLLGRIAVIGGGGVLVIGAASVFRNCRSAALVMALPGFVAGGTMLALGHNLWPRFFFFCMGFAVLFVIRGVSALPVLLRIGPVQPWLTIRTAQRVGLGVASLMIPASISILPRCYALPKQDFVGARDYVERSRSNGDTIVAVGLAGVAYESYYAPQWTVAQTRDELDRLRSTRPGLWLVYTLPIEVRAYHPGMWELIEQEFDIVKVFPGTLGDGAVIVCRGRDAEDAAR